MKRLESLTITVFEDAIGKPYIVIEDESYGAVELKFWANNVEIKDMRRSDAEV